MHYCKNLCPSDDEYFKLITEMSRGINLKTLKKDSKPSKVKTHYTHQWDSRRRQTVSSCVLWSSFIKSDKSEHHEHFGENGYLVVLRYFGKSISL